LHKRVNKQLYIDLFSSFPPIMTRMGGTISVRRTHTGRSQGRYVRKYSSELPDSKLDEAACEFDAALLKRGLTRDQIEIADKDVRFVNTESGSHALMIDFLYS
jgi:hypothetical protein